MEFNLKCCVAPRLALVHASPGAARLLVLTSSTSHTSF
jgi:hypothetical protein